MGSFLVLDAGGIHVDTARKLGFEGHDTYYWNPWQSAYPQFQDYAPGVGASKITKVVDYAPFIDKVDCIVVPDVGLGGLTTWLRNKGYPVYGAGIAEQLELDRKFSCEVMEKHGLKYPKTHYAKGLDEALKKLEEIGVPLKADEKCETNQLLKGKAFVKFDMWRGDLETFPAASIEEAKRMFDKMRGSIGPYSESIPVCIQEMVEGIESGVDLFFNGEEFVKPYMIGWESGGDYVGCITENLSIYENDLDKVAQLLKKMNYRGALSLETIYDGDSHYILDWTTRHGMPLGMLYTVYVDQLGNLFYDVAKKKSTTTQLPKGSYIGSSMISSEEAANTYVSIKGNPTTRWMRFMEQGGTKYAVPGTSMLGIIPGKGKTLEDLDLDIKKNAEGVETFFGSFNVNFVDDVKEKYLNPFKEQFGIEFSPDYVDTPESYAKKLMREAKSIK